MECESGVCGLRVPCRVLWSRLSRMRRKTMPSSSVTTRPPGRRPPPVPYTRSPLHHLPRKGGTRRPCCRLTKGEPTQGSAHAGNAIRGERGAAGEAGGRRARVGRGPPIPPSGPAHEEHGRAARVPRRRVESHLPRDAHRHQKGPRSAFVGGGWAQGVRSPLRRPPPDR